MKKVLIVISVMFSMVSFSGTAMALQEKDINFNGGFGAFGSRGVAGFSIDRLFTQNHALSVAVGLDFIGATSTVGYKYFGDKSNNSNSFWDKCFFLFECDTHPYIGASAQYAGATTVKITEDGQERDYNTDPKWLGIGSAGFRDIFKNNITMDLEISYRNILAGGKSAQTAGLVADDTKVLEMGYRTVGFGLALGYLFRERLLSAAP